jgi:large subunit ribosomal protein L7/L12
MTIWVGAGVGVVVGFVLAMVTRWVGSRRANPADLSAAAWAQSQQVGAVRPSLRPGVDPEALRREIAALLRQGKKIQAIKLLREAAPLSLAEAKTAVERVEAGGQLPIGPVDDQGPWAGKVSDDRGGAYGLDLDPGVFAEIRYLAHGGKKIQAIKLLREHTEIDLRSAKETVERL